MSKSQSHVVTAPIPSFLSRSGAIEVHALPADHDNLVWLLVDRAGRVATVVDGPNAEATLARCEQLGVRLTAVWNTHTHGDHIGINRDLGERGLISSLRVVASRNAKVSVPGVTDQVGEGHRFEFASQEVTVLATPGHQDGHISFVVDGLLLCGDTLFAGGCGYLFDGPPSAMHESLSKLASLDPDTKVLCAHEYTLDNLRFAWSIDPECQALAQRIVDVRQMRDRGECTLPSTIELERATNPFLRTTQTSVMRGLERALARSLPPDERESAQVFALLRKHKDQGAYKSIPDDELPSG